MGRIFKKNKVKIIFLVFVFMSLLIRLQNIRLPIGNDMHSFRQTETAIIIQGYLEEGFSAFNYEMPVLGKPWTILFEFPIYQTVVYAVLKLLHRTNIDLWGRLVSIVIFYLSALALKKVSDLFWEKKVSYLICLVYLFTPFNILWSRAILMDYTAVLFALLYVLGLYSWLQKGGKANYALALISGSCAYLVKGTTMFPYVFSLAFLIINFWIKEIEQGKESSVAKKVKEYVKRNILKIILLGVLCLLPALLGIAWTKYTDVVKGRSIYTQFLCSDNLKSWNFGTLKQKTQWSNWLVILKRLEDFFGGKFVLLFLILSNVFVGKKKNRYFLCGCIVSTFLTIWLLFNLYYRHDYYLIAVSPLMSITLGILAYEILQSLHSGGKAGQVGLSFIVSLLLFIQVETNNNYLSFINQDSTNRAVTVGLYVKEITDSDERILVEGYDWDPTVLYYAGRKGFMRREEAADDTFYNNLLQEDNYTTFVVRNLNYLEEISGYYDMLIQYRKLENTYIYKFGQELLDQSKVYGNIALEPDKDLYDIEAEHVQILEIEYNEEFAGAEIQVSLINESGEQYTDTIYLFRNQDTAYFNVGAVMENVKQVEIIDINK
ncbi:MAG: glycosyltransferase family 39 protein [Lachnospiraceae bacterium]|nr:glycosyltransferase family 39 protein [Lachnospiraceae bacterium]